jgi:hypothetical protein
VQEASSGNLQLTGRERDWQRNQLPQPVKCLCSKIRRGASTSVGTSSASDKSDRRQRVLSPALSVVAACIEESTIGPRLRARPATRRSAACERTAVSGVTAPAGVRFTRRSTNRANQRRDALWRCLRCDAQWV